MRPDEDKTQENMTNYVDALCREIAATRRLNDDTSPLQTIFFGGGTPALISPFLLEQILNALDRSFGIDFSCSSSSAPSPLEISIEADPGCFTASTLRTYKSLGINRVSVGVQSFDNDLLALCGRAHDAADVFRAIESVYAADIPSWSLDLMSGLPNLTESIWESTLRTALDTSPPHISVYDLQIEPQTPFAKQYRPGEFPLPSEEDATRMYKTASHVLRGSGFEHYEISNYAKPGHRCAHNMTYWKGLPHYAFGMGAASYLQGIRFSRPKRLGAYLQWLNDDFCQSHDGTDSADRSDTARSDDREDTVKRKVPGEGEVPVESVDDRITDTIMLRLRLADGLHTCDLSVSHTTEDGEVVDADGDSEVLVDVVVNALKEHEQRGHVEFVYHDDEGSNQTAAAVSIIKLTDPDGFVMSNDVISDIFVALDDMKSDN